MNNVIAWFTKFPLVEFTQTERLNIQIDIVSDIQIADRSIFVPRELYEELWTGYNKGFKD